MTHLAIPEWGKIPVRETGSGTDGFTRAQANALIEAAREHPLGGADGTGILTDHYRYLRAGQMVGVLAAGDCSLEILPKIDPAMPDEDAPTARARLIQMLDVALGLKISSGAQAAMSVQGGSLLDILIRVFADRLLTAVRHGLPRQYRTREDDLNTLRGRLHVGRQYTVLAARPNRLACRYDELSPDIAIVQVMKACVLFVSRFARAGETRRRLEELRFLLADITTVPNSALPWADIHMDRTNRTWAELVTLARMLMGRDWQDSRHDTGRQHGISLLFPMNDLFETYIASLAGHVARKHGLMMESQGGGLFCVRDADAEGRNLFQTRPDIILRDPAGRASLIIDTKWKHISSQIEDKRQGVSQSDVYQMMAYGELYDCVDLVLLYPRRNTTKTRRRLPIKPSGTRALRVTDIDITADRYVVETELGELFGGG
jgi:5-methylcytosine-specific restriction enzyme subunit McrC